MPKVVVTISEDIKRKMKQFPDVNWDEKIEEAISKELQRQLLGKLADKMFKDSALTEEDALELGKDVKRSLHKQFKKEHPEKYKHS